MAIPPAHKERFGKAGTFVLGAFVSALVAGPVAYHYATRANTVMVVQQNTLAAVQQFESTGASLDNAVRQFSDSLVARRGVDEARQGLRAAVAGHSSQVFTMRDTLGEADYRRYMAVLVQLRDRADNADDAREGVQVWQSAVDLIGYRRRLADRIKAEIENA